MKVVFLDIDGVLNCHDWDEAAQSCRIRHKCVKELNRVVAATGAKVVLSSAWRYMIHGRAMTLLGFQYLLRTHGGCGLNVVGVTEPDETCPGCGHRHRRKPLRLAPKFDQDSNRVCVRCETPSTRGRQVSAWLKWQVEEAGGEVERYVVIDDLPFDFRKLKHPLVLTDCDRGLTERDADRAIRLLNRR